MMDIVPNHVTDEEVVNEFKNERPWGLSSMVHIYNCDDYLIKDIAYVKQFIVDLCDFIDMKRYGESIVERFGSGNLYGISFVQLIHTSCIVGHISEETGTIYLDVFSCREFSPNMMAEFAREYFSGDSVEIKTIFRD